MPVIENNFFFIELGLWLK